MRIAFVQDMLGFSIPLGTTMIASILRKAGHDIDLFVVDNKFEKTLKELEQFKPDIIGFSVISGSHKGYIKIAQVIKQRLNIPILWGGPHVTFFPKIIEEDYVDAVCVGEGEEAALEFANAFDKLNGKIPTNIKNFWVKLDGVIHRNPIRPRIKNLDDLPYPARDLYINKYPILKKHGIKHFLAHRGCPHKCTYCFNHSYNKMYREQAGDKKVLFSRTPDSIVDEILWFKNQEIVKEVHFVDDVFTIDKKWTIKFAEIYAKKCGIPFSINARFDHFDEEIVSALAKANLSLVYAGIEAGNDYIRDTVMEREQSKEEIFTAVNLFKKYGIKFLTQNVLGNPGETFEMAMETLELNMKLKPTIADATIFAPYPGLKMTRYAIEKGYFDGNFDRLESTYFESSVLKFDRKGDENKIFNLRCLFSLLSNHPKLLFFVKPLLSLRLKKLFWWVGYALDGYYYRKGMAYRQGFNEFFTTVVHYFTNYRSGSDLKSKT